MSELPQYDVKNVDDDSPDQEEDTSRYSTDCYLIRAQCLGGRDLPSYTNDLNMHSCNSLVECLAYKR